MNQWREQRASQVQQVAALPRFETRSELIADISALLLANRTIHGTYGPESPLARSPISTGATTWHREATQVILPNNRRILELAEANDGLLERGDRFALAEFKVHNDAFTYNLLSGDKDENAPVFPVAMSERFDNDP